MMNYSIIPNNDLASKAADNFSKFYTANTNIGSMERVAKIIERFSNGETLTESDAKEANLPLVHQGFNVYEDNKGRTWWMEDGMIYRPNDQEIYNSIQLYLNQTKLSNNK